MNFDLSPNKNYLLILFLISISVMSPVLIYGIPVGTADLLHHLQISNAITDSLKNGSFQPNWVLSENNNYGAVTVRFYPPLFHYSLALFKISTDNLQISIFLTFSFWCFVGAVGMFFFADETVKSKFQAFLASLLFILSPYHLNQFYNSFMFGEFVALSITPFLFLYCYRLCQNPNLINCVSLAVSFCLILLSNLPQTIICALCLGIYILLNLKKELFTKTIFYGLISLVLALVLGAFFWVRTLLEMNWLNIAQPNTDPEYDFNNHFLLNDFSFDGKGIWFASLIFALTVVLTSVFLLLAKITSQPNDKIREKKDLANILILSSFSAVMMLPLSSYIWENAHFLQRVQFPWRFLSVLTLCFSVIAAFTYGRVNGKFSPNSRPFILVFWGLVLIYATFSLKQVVLGGVFASPKDFQQIEKNLAENKGLFHWLPVWVNVSAFDVNNILMSGNRTYEIIKWENEHREFFIAEGDSTQARVALMYYPHWKGIINNKTLILRKSSDGTTEFDLPSDKAHIKLYFSEPDYSIKSRYISLFGWIASGILFIFHYFKKRRKL